MLVIILQFIQRSSIIEIQAEEIKRKYSSPLTMQELSQENFFLVKKT